MKKLFLMTVMCFLFTQYGKAQLNFGAGAVFIPSGTVLGVQGKAVYGINDKIDIAADLTYFLPKLEVTTISLNADVHYNFMMIGGDKPLYGLGGLNYSRFSFGGFSDSYIGLNLGAGIMLNQIFIETKYLFQEGGGDIVFSAGYLF